MNKYKKPYVNYQICSYLTSQGWGYSGFQVTGMTEGFFWVRNLRFQDYFWLGKFWQVFFLVA